MSAFSSITFKNITFGFEGEQIVTDFSFEAKPGKHTILKGESGSGKSTLLKLLLGFYNPQSGRITIDGNPYDCHNLRRKTAWLPQDLNLGSGSVKEVIGQPFEFAANQPHQQNIAQKSIATLQQLGLGADILDKEFRDLSTGQRQRVGLTICHLLDKPLLLLDEPTSALDRASKAKAEELLLSDNRTIISTSHDSFWVDKADNIIEL